MYLTENPEYPPFCLDDLTFIHFFKEFCTQQHYTEFYLLDAFGSFLFLDAKANPTFLVVTDEEGMQSQYETVELCDTPTPDDLLTQIESKEKILYFFNQNPKDIDSRTWDRYAHPAKKIIGKETYYYTVSNDSALYDIYRDDIVSYDQYLRSL